MFNFGENIIIQKKQYHTKLKQMQLDYIENINAYGDNIVRLYDFDRKQADKFMKLLIQSIIKNKKQMDLSTINFIESRNCSLILRISDEDFGIITDDNENFFCDMTIKSYKHIIKLIEPFCLKETKAHQFLYDVDSLTDFLFSPAGTLEEDN